MAILKHARMVPSQEGPGEGRMRVTLAETALSPTGRTTFMLIDPFPCDIPALAKRSLQFSKEDAFLVGLNWWYLNVLVFLVNLALCLAENIKLAIWTKDSFMSLSRCLVLARGQYICLLNSRSPSSLLKLVDKQEETQSWVKGSHWHLGDTSRAS